MANAKKIIRIVGIILLIIGLIIIISCGYFMSVVGGSLWLLFLFPFITGIVLFVIGLVLLITSRKKILAANAKKMRGIIIGIIFLVSGLTMIIYYGLSMYVVGISWFVFLPTVIIGVVLFVIGLVLLILSRKKTSKSLV